MEAETYFKVHGDMKVPRGYIQNGIILYNWLAEQRQIHRGNRKGRSLTEEKIQKLDLLNMKWRSSVESGWDRGLSQAKEYFAEHGNLDVPASYVSTSGYRLGVWLSRCRTKYLKGKMSAEHMSELENLNMVLSHRNDWNGCFRHVREYYDAHGDLYMPKDYTVNGVWLYK